MSAAAPRPCDGSQGGEAAPRGVATGVKAPERGPSPPRALLRLPLLLPGFALALPMRPLLTRGPGQILWALAPGRLVPLATWHPYPHRSLLLALSTAVPVADTAGHSRLGSRAVTQPPRRSGPGAMDGVAQTGRSAAAPAAATSWASLVRAAQNGSSGKCSQPQATPAASWGRGAGWLVDPCQACGTSAQDSVTHLLAKPSSEARQAQTRRHWPRGLDESLQEGSSSMPCKDRQLRGGGRALGAEHGEGHPAVLWDPVGSCGTQTRDSHLCWDQNKNVKSSEQV